MVAGAMLDSHHRFPINESLSHYLAYHSDRHRCPHTQSDTSIECLFSCVQRLGGLEFRGWTQIVAFLAPCRRPFAAVPSDVLDCEHCVFCFLDRSYSTHKAGCLR